MEAQKNAPTVSNQSAISSEQGHYNTADQKLCSGYGKYHSPNAKRNPRPLETVTLADIEAMAVLPPSVAKDSAQWVIPSTLLSRSHAEQRLDGEYWALWADVDKTKGLTFSELVEIARRIIPGGFIAYTSRSAREDNQKARLIIALSEPVSGSVWKALQKILNAKLEAAGVTPDDVNEHTGQPCYLPNRGEFYAYHIEAEEWLGFMSSDCWADELAAEAEREAKEAAAKRAQAEQAKLKPKPVNLFGYNAGIIDKVSAAFEMEGELQARNIRKIGDRFLSPQSETGSAGIVLLERDGKTVAFSHHGTADPLSNLNHDGHALDMFDVICTLDYAGDVSKAVHAMAEKLDPEGQKQRQRDHMAAKDTLSRFTPEQVERLTMEAEAEHTGPEFDLPPLPNELYALPDGLGAIQDYIHGAMTYPCRYTAGWAALATLTGFAQTNVTIDSRRGLGFNEYYLTLAKTGFGKEELRDPLNTLISELDFDSNVSDSNLPAVEQAAPSSKQGLHSVLEAADNHSVYVQSDEFAEWLKAASNDSHKQQALAYLLEIYNRALRKIHPGHAVTNKYEAVKNPRLSVFATTTAESVLRSLNLNDAEMGAYNRWVIYVAPETMPEKRYTGMNFTPSLEAVSAVAFIASMTPTKIAFTACGLKEYIAQDKEHAEPIKFKDGLMGGRLSEQAIKLAGLIALSAKRTEINSDDVELAYKIRMGLYYRTAALVEQSGAISGSHETTKALEQVRNALKPGTPIYVSQLKSRSRAYNALHLNEQNAVIRTLIEHGDAEFIDDRRKVLVWRK